MLLTRDNLHDRLNSHLAKSTRVDVAVAWACNCQALDNICEFATVKGRLLRVIVGTWGNISHPIALREIHKKGNLRLVPNAKYRFHPKLYLFH